jgi:hypothetical protein
MVEASCLGCQAGCLTYSVELKPEGTLLPRFYGLMTITHEISGLEKETINAR